MASVQFVNEGRTFDVLPGTKLRRVGLRSGIQLESLLYRIFRIDIRIGPLSFFSASDVVEIEGKGVNVRSEEEEKALEGRFLRRFKIGPNLRLASQVLITGDVLVRTMARREIDRKLTREQTGYFVLVSGFAIVVLFMVALVGLDLVKKL